MWYWCEATSLEGFVQQLAVCYVGRGYHFYVTGRVPPDKDGRDIDRKLLLKYGVIMPKWTRSRRKKPRTDAAGRVVRRAVMQYIRHEGFFVLLATEGEHRFFQDEAHVKDVRVVPITYAGYSISLRAGRVHVRIAEGAYKDLRAYFLNIAVHRSVPKLIAEFYSIPFEPYGPVKAQLFSLLGEVNDLRRRAGFAKVPKSAVWLKRRYVKPFAPPEAGAWRRPGGADAATSGAVARARPPSLPAAGATPEAVAPSGGTPSGAAPDAATGAGRRPGPIDWSWWA